MPPTTIDRIERIERFKRKKAEAAAAAANAAAAGDSDHRKRRRNRTTQSCLNCHTSKRMCDRKRPCGRCTQLGLTSLCVYEVDDPATRNESADDRCRLQMKVAELEGVIREMKDKPYPHRQSGALQMSDSHYLDHLRPSTTESGSSADSIMVATPPSYKPCQGLSLPGPVLEPPTPLSEEAHFTPLTTPAFSFSPGAQAYFPQNDTASIFSYLAQPDGLAGDPFNSVHGEAGDSVRAAASKHSPMGDLFPLQLDSKAGCHCISDSSVYGIMSELSLHLHQTHEFVSRHPLHLTGNACALKQRISDLDALVAWTLASIHGDNTAPLSGSYFIPTFSTRPGPGLEPLCVEQIADNGPTFSSCDSGMVYSEFLPPSTISPEILSQPKSVHPHATWNVAPEALFLSQDGVSVWSHQYSQDSQPSAVVFAPVPLPAPVHVQQQQSASSCA